ncbi:helix-hairpin-helix domain-containing protein [Lutibacter sp. HS1-25]|uniref:ComEA family DNA-binding protein n=1 Tax=Lutibacter sp. HS1-25 TaxID=2485000 RepID=UPI001013699F|nr:helix-hairpin-helix domain-containing protein [Lutibacter sp. HS1-25]RXP63344.1 helix-hairpin-helix domain-containing protein [Lutibacter sp. HS1-25]
MNSFKSHFRYNKRQRNGILFLLIIIILLQLVFFFVDFSSEEKNSANSAKLIIFQQEMDSLRFVELENSKPKIYPFNPNYITDYKGYQLGMSVEEIDKLLDFRKNGAFINSAKQFQEITGVSDSLLNVLSPYFKFPDWIDSSKSNSNDGNNTVKKAMEIQDLNLATVEDLKKVKGIGEVLASRIVNYRTKLQGFSMNEQLYEVWNLDEEVANDVLKYFRVKTPPTIQKINVNTATFKEVLAIVYIDYELTKKIFNYRDEVAEIQSLEELKKIEGFPLDKFNRIALYLQAK